MSGNITRRGANSWRLKFEAAEPDPVTGKRQTRYVTVRGTKKDAQRELTRLLAEVQNGTTVDPSLVTISTKSSRTATAAARPHRGFGRLFDLTVLRSAFIAQIPSNGVGIHTRVG